MNPRSYEIVPALSPLLVGAAAAPESTLDFHSHLIKDVRLGGVQGSGGHSREPGQCLQNGSTGDGEQSHR